MSIYSKILLGKIFISYSSKDKYFVRRFAQRLENDGFQIWFDEKELNPGDKIISKLSDAIENCKLFLVVISENSYKSKWLKYELELASTKMVEKGITLIPILKDNVEIPNYLQGIIYADFRNGKKNSYKKLLKSINEIIPAKIDQQSFWSQIQFILDEIFDGRSYIHYSVGKSFSSCETVRIKMSNDIEDISIAFDIITEYDYGFSNSLYKKERDIDFENLSVTFFLLIYEDYSKTVGVKRQKKIEFIEAEEQYWYDKQYTVILDMAKNQTYESRIKVLANVKKQIKKLYLKNNA